MDEKPENASGEAGASSEPGIESAAAQPGKDPHGRPSFHLSVANYLRLEEFISDIFIEAMSTEITGRRQIELALRESENTLRVWMNAVQESAFLIDPDGIVLAVNLTAAQRMHRSVEEMTGACIFDFVPPVVGPLRREHLAEAIQTRKPVRFDDERFGRIMDNMVYPVVDSDGQIRKLAVLATDITGRRKAEEELRKSQQKFRQIAETIDEVFWIADTGAQVFEYISPSYERVWGRTCQSLYDAPQSFFDAIIPQDRRQVSAYLEAEKTGQPFEIEYRILRPDGAIRWISDHAYPLGGKDGQVQVYIGSAHDITGRKLAEDQLRQAEAKYRDIFENAINGIFQSTPDGRFINLNLAMARIFGYETPEQMIAAVGDQIPTSIYADPADRARFIQPLLENGMLQEFEARNRCKDGSIIWTRTSARAIKDADGNVVYFEGFLEDITESKAAQEELQKANEMLQSRLDKIQLLQKTLLEQANHDTLTGLYNRRYLYATIERELARARRDRLPLGVMMIDIDHFKKFNDTYGHEAGDEVLRALSNLLRSSIRSSDIACRYGGEEFLVLMPGTDEVNAGNKAESLRIDFNRLRIRHNSSELSAAISIGIAAYPEAGSGMDDVFRAADFALYEAKQAGRNCVRVWKKGKTDELRRYLNM